MEKWTKWTRASCKYLNELLHRVKWDWTVKGSVKPRVHHNYKGSERHSRLIQKKTRIQWCPVWLWLLFYSSSPPHFFSASKCSRDGKAMSFVLFLRTQKALTITKNMDKLDFTKMKNFHSSKDTIKRLKRPTTEKGKIFVIYISNKAHIIQNI